MEKAIKRIQKFFFKIVLHFLLLRKYFQITEESKGRYTILCFSLSIPMFMYACVYLCVYVPLFRI